MTTDPLTIAEKAALANAYERVIADLSQQRGAYLTAYDTASGAVVATDRREPLGLRVQRREQAKRHMFTLDSTIALLKRHLAAIEQE